MNERIDFPHRRERREVRNIKARGQKEQVRVTPGPGSAVRKALSIIKADQGSLKIFIVVSAFMHSRFKNAYKCVS